jgi:hypothetical protein
MGLPPADPPAVVLPVNAVLPHILRIALEHDPAEIERAGLAAVVAEAEKKRDAILERATKLLAPLEIPQEVLRSLVDAWVRRRFEGDGVEGRAGVSGWSWPAECRAGADARTRTADLLIARRRGP